MNKNIVQQVIELLSTTLGQMPSREADRVVASCMKILQIELEADGKDA